VVDVIASGRRRTTVFVYEKRSRQRLFDHDHVADHVKVADNDHVRTITTTCFGLL